MSAHTYSVALSGGTLILACSSCGQAWKGSTIAQTQLAPPDGGCRPVATSHDWKVTGERVALESRALAYCVGCGTLRAGLIGAGGWGDPNQPLDLSGECLAAKVAA